MIGMKKPIVFHLVVLWMSLMVVDHCSATMYTVGDTSGWDISTDLGTWSRGKTFAVGDVLVFQSSSTYNVVELTKQNFDACNTSNAIHTYTSSGNTTVTLNKPGDWYFADGNKLYCLGGMKLHIHVASAAAPAASPQAAAGPGSATAAAGLPRTSRTNLPTSEAHQYRPAAVSNFLQLAPLLIINIGFLGYLLT